MPLCLFTPQKVHAGGIQLAIDPYNDSGSNAIPIESNPSQVSVNSSVNNNLPFNNSEISIDSVYYIQGNSTPPRPSIVSGNLITSNQSLPAIPNIAEPYSPQQTSAVVNSPNVASGSNSSVSISPFDITPQEDKPVNSISVSPVTTSLDRTNNNSNNNSVRTISVSPQNPVQNSVSNSPSINSNSDNSSTNDLNRRRNLRDILVFSPSSNPVSSQNNNNGNNQPSVSVASTSTGNNRVYRVLAQTNNNSQETGVRSLYPEAFKTNYQGQSLLQVGVFSTPERAEQVSQSLTNIGVRAIILK